MVIGEWGSKLEKRIRACYDEFLEVVPDVKEWWEIALLEYYRYPLECWSANPEEEWELAIPDCFNDLAPEFSRLTAHKKEVCPNSDYCSVQENLLREYDEWHHKVVFHCEEPVLKLPPEAIILLLEYYLLVEVQDDGCGYRPYRQLFAGTVDEGTPDRKTLERIVRQNIHTPEEQKTLALQLYEICERWKLERELPCEETDWVFEMIENLLLCAFDCDCAEAGWYLYDILMTKERWDLVEEPCEVLRRAAEGGSVDAQLEIGCLFWKAILEESEEDFKEHPKAEAAECSTDFTGEEAVYWLEQALPYNKYALPLLADIMLQCKGIKVDEERITRCLGAVVERKYEEGTEDFFYQERCMQAMAGCYAAGRGVEKDCQKAAELYPLLYGIEVKGPREEL